MMKTNITDQELSGHLKQTTLKKKEIEAIRQYMLSEETLMEIANAHQIDSDRLLDMVISVYKAIRRPVNAIEMDKDTFLSVSDALNIQYKTQKILEMILVDGYTTMQVYRLFVVPRKRMEAKIKLMKKMLASKQEQPPVAVHSM